MIKLFSVDFRSFQNFANLAILILKIPKSKFRLPKFTNPVSP